MKILNRKAYHDYFILKEFTAGMQLVGSEVKSLRNGDANLQDSFCFISNGEIFVKGLYISKNKMSSYENHEEKRDRKLLLTKREIKNISNEIKFNNGMTIVPLEIFELKGRFKLKIGIAKGKKNYNKKEDLKTKDIKREIKRNDNFNI
jgi:SsrA-binding protein